MLKYPNVLMVNTDLQMARLAKLVLSFVKTFQLVKQASIDQLLMQTVLNSSHVEKMNIGQLQIKWTVKKFLNVKR